MVDPAVQESQNPSSADSSAPAGSASPSKLVNGPESALTVEGNRIDELGEEAGDYDDQEEDEQEDAWSDEEDVEGSANQVVYAAPRVEEDWDAEIQESHPYSDELRGTYRFGAWESEVDKVFPERARFTPSDHHPVPTAISLVRAKVEDGQFDDAD